MIIYTSEQGTTEWLQDRAGVITASMFAECCKRLKSGKNKGGFSAKAEDYAFRLAVERISGYTLDEGGFDTFAMKRGRELEPLARSLHEIKSGVTVDEAGFVCTDDRLFGASADGFINNDGGAEYKCFIAPEKLRPILFDESTEECEYQIQGGLWITGRKYWDFCLYCPALEIIGKDMKVIRRERNDEFIEEMETGLLEFNGLVEEYKNRLIN